MLKKRLTAALNDERFAVCFFYFAFFYVYLTDFKQKFETKKMNSTSLIISYFPSPSLLLGALLFLQNVERTVNPSGMLIMYVVYQCTSLDGVHASCVLQGVSAGGSTLEVGVMQEDTTSPGFRWLRFELSRGFVAWDMKPDSKAVGK